MASTTNSDGSDGSSGGSSMGGIVDFLTQPLGMAAVGGFIAAIVAGYLII